MKSVVDAYGLKSIEGNTGDVTVHEDVAEMGKGYKVGTSLPFTATLDAAFADSTDESSSSD